jgi:uncharacterized glyoxalase superfamily protein PhnB
MELTAVTPMIWVENLEESIAFYKDKLDFEVVGKSNKKWVQIQKDAVRLMLALPNAKIPFDKPIFTGSIYIYAKDVDLIWEKLKNITEVVYPLEETEYGTREFAIYDNSGYLLQFGTNINGNIEEEY